MNTSQPYTEDNTEVGTIRRVQVYTLAEALVEAQKGALDGYEVDLVTNEGYPSQYISSISFNMVKKGVSTSAKADVKPEVQSSVQTSVQPQYTKQKRTKVTI